MVFSKKLEFNRKKREYDMKTIELFRPKVDGKIEGKVTSSFTKDPLGDVKISYSYKTGPDTINEAFTTKDDGKFQITT